MTEETIYASYPVFKLDRRRVPDTAPEVMGKELLGVIEDHSGHVTLRGAYSTLGFRANADLMLWLVASTVDAIQNLLVDMRRTAAGRALDTTENFLGLVRPAEFAKDHLPSFVKGLPPKRYTCVYPFVRTPDWYLLEPAERGALLREHGEGGREFSDDVQANTISAFGLGDYEWILAFESERLDRIVDLIRRLRSTEARRYTKLEIPFVTGIRKEIGTIIEELI